MSADAPIAVENVPGCAPQCPQVDRIQSQQVNPENSWAAAMAQVQPQSGITKNPNQQTNPGNKP